MKRKHKLTVLISDRERKVLRRLAEYDGESVSAFIRRGIRSEGIMRGYIEHTPAHAPLNSN